MEENHQLRVNTCTPRTVVHCLLSAQSEPKNCTEDRDFLFSRHIKCTSMKGRGEEGMEKKSHMADLRGEHVCSNTENIRGIVQVQYIPAKILSSS